MIKELLPLISMVLVLSVILVACAPAAPAAPAPPPPPAARGTLAVGFVRPPCVNFRCRFFVRHPAAASVRRKILFPVLAQPDFQQRGNIFRRGGGRDRERDAGGICFRDQRGGAGGEDVGRL